MFEGKSVTDDIALTSTLLKITASTIPLYFHLDTTPCCQISVWKRLVALFRKFQASKVYLFLKKKKINPSSISCFSSIQNPWEIISGDLRLSFPAPEFLYLKNSHEVFSWFKVMLNIYFASSRLWQDLAVMAPKCFQSQQNIIQSTATSRLVSAVKLLKNKGGNCECQIYH